MNAQDRLLKAARRIRGHQPIHTVGTQTRAAQAWRELNDAIAEVEQERRTGIAARRRWRFWR